MKTDVIRRDNAYACKHRHLKVVDRRAYHTILIPRHKRRWWHRIFPPKTPQHFCRKCGEAVRQHDMRYYL